MAAFHILTGQELTARKMTFFAAATRKRKLRNPCFAGVLEIFPQRLDTFLPDGIILSLPTITICCSFSGRLLLNVAASTRQNGRVREQNGFVSCPQGLLMPHIIRHVAKPKIVIPA